MAKMATTTNLRSRRSAAQLHALAGVEREIRAQDHHGRRKYLREFNQAFRSYECVLDGQQVRDAVHAADLVLVGDYHALGNSQRQAAHLLEQRALAGDRPVVLGVETIFARDQHILDEWWRREIDEEELRQRIRFDLDWGYDWAPFYQLLVAARDHAEALYGLDCMPREDLRKIGARDRHAAVKIAEIRERHPNAVIFVLFGESHMAPEHLPRNLRKQIPEARILTVLQNVDALYWRAAGERADQVDAVRVREDVLCVFNATPLEKYESYRLFLDQWSRADDSPDFAPTIYNLIDSLANFLEIDRYSSHNGTQPKFLVDMLPEIYGGSSLETLSRFLARRGINAHQLQAMMERIDECGGAYLPSMNAFYIREFKMMHAAEDAAHFLHQACQGLPRRLQGQPAGWNASPPVPRRTSTLDRFYRRVIESAVAYFGSRVLYPSRPAPETGDSAGLSRSACEKAAEAAIAGDDAHLESAARELGQKMGNQIYEAYLSGKVTARGLRRLFLAHLDEPGLARKVCAAVVAKLRAISRPLARAAHA
jgi:Haem-binding uptake, Tiki superfamily, ChaN